MNSQLRPDMIEATRLIQAGRLGEATALLQQLLGGEVANPAGYRGETPPPRQATTIDLTAEEIVAPPHEASAQSEKSEDRDSGDGAPQALSTSLRSVVGHLGRMREALRHGTAN